MTFTLTPVYTAFFNKIKNNAALAAMLKGVYTVAPEAKDSSNNNGYPFLVIESFDEQPLNTNTKKGAEISFTVSIKSRYQGDLQIMQIRDALYSALDGASLSAVGVDILFCDNIRSTITQGEDAKTRVGRFDYRLLVTER